MPAFLGAVPACLGAVLAVIFGVFAAFLRARIAGVGANAAQLIHEPRAAAHEGDAQAAQVAAVDAQPCAIRHVPEAGIGAVMTLLRTLMTGGDARLMVLVRHDFLPELGPPSFHARPMPRRTRLEPFLQLFLGIHQKKKLSVIVTESFTLCHSQGAWDRQGA